MLSQKASHIAVAGSLADFCHHPYCQALISLGIYLGHPNFPVAGAGLTGFYSEVPPNFRQSGVAQLMGCQAGTRALPQARRMALR